MGQRGRGKTQSLDQSIKAVDDGHSGFSGPPPGLTGWVIRQ
jgi:hypothetical protein